MVAERISEGTLAGYSLLARLHRSHMATIPEDHAWQSAVGSGSKVPVFWGSCYLSVTLSNLYLSVLLRKARHIFKRARGHSQRRLSARRCRPLKGLPKSKSRQTAIKTERNDSRPRQGPYKHRWSQFDPAISASLTNAPFPPASSDM
jgi:hypothetical protein